MRASMEAAARAIAAELNQDYDADPDRWYHVACVGKSAYNRSEGSRASAKLSWAASPFAGVETGYDEP